MKVSTTNFNQLMNELEAEIERRGDRVELWQNADVLIMWQDVLGHAQEVVKEARSVGKKVYTYEHGLLSINDYLPPISRPMISDLYLTWGEAQKRWLVEKAGVNPDRVQVTGTTIFSRLGPRVPHEGKNVLFAPRHWDKPLAENYQVAEILKKYDKAKVSSKLVHGEHDPDAFPNPIISYRHNPDHFAVSYEALKEADVVIGIGEGTFAALAFWMDIPYISVDNWGQNDLLGVTYTRERFNSQLSEASRKVPINKLLDMIDQELENPHEYSFLRKAFVNEYLDGGDPKKALQKQLSVIYGENQI
jgi:hypothetical protein